MKEGIEKKKEWWQEEKVKEKRQEFLLSKRTKTQEAMLPREWDEWITARLKESSPHERGNRNSFFLYSSWRIMAANDQSFSNKVSSWTSIDECDASESDSVQEQRES